MFFKKGMFSSLLLLMICVVTNVGQVKAESIENYFGISISDEEYANLLSLGFTEDDIYYMNMNTYINNRNLHGEVAGTSERYFKTEEVGVSGISSTVEVSKDEYDNPSVNLLRGMQETSYKKLTSSIIAVDNHKYRFQVKLYWKTMPAVRNYDIIGVGFDSNVYISSGVSFDFRYNISGNITSESIFFAYQQGRYGAAKTYRIPSKGTELTTTMYFDVSPMAGEDASHLRICGDYSHATKTVSTSDLFDYNIGYNGIQLYEALLSKYDSIPCATTIVSNATW